MNRIVSTLAFSVIPRQERTMQFSNKLCNYRKRPLLRKRFVFLWQCKGPWWGVKWWLCGSKVINLRPATLERPLGSHTSEFSRKMDPPPPQQATKRACVCVKYFVNCQGTQSINSFFLVPTESSWKWVSRMPDTCIELANFWILVLPLLMTGWIREWINQYINPCTTLTCYPLSNENRHLYLTGVLILATSRSKHQYAMTIPQFSLDCQFTAKLPLSFLTCQKFLFKNPVFRAKEFYFYPGASVGISSSTADIVSKPPSLLTQSSFFFSFSLLCFFLGKTFSPLFSFVSVSPREVI